MLETERLILKPVTQQDIDVYTELLSCPKITRYLPGGQPFSDDYIKNYVPKKVAHWRHGFGTFILFLKSDPRVKIGYAGVEYTTDSQVPDIRYGLLESYQGFGYAYEAAKVSVEYTLTNTDIKRIFGVAVEENQASVKLLKKLGMQPSDTVVYDADGLVTFSITQKDLESEA
ncbi:GNAT family N-acetyltransferase [Vibrio sp. LaRot3]|uniref:GNAT family N-acetyltransferase n=1 Tax=Vibrio sp. LaRot3 TaxID=2998829 RepID=UPI0022CDEC2A|nr:GNAT family N-acetyltransferase [Vibrio sp. LaRot3]MDA0148278.1 GNAT family N-acetyltransferase [Vibrio sp. LaRot3]